MQNPRLAARYAKSLLDLSIERGSLEETLADMYLLDKICNMSRDFVNMLRSPVITGDKKTAITTQILAGKTQELTMAFFKLLISKGREQSLPEIASAFIAQYNLAKNITTVKLTSAAAMGDQLQSEIIAKVQTFITGNTIELKTAVDPELIGGFVIEVGDHLYDASVKKKLQDIRSQVVDYSYVSKM